MIHFKSCPRCETGDVVVDRDVYGWHVLCLQCGYMKDLNGPGEADVVLEKRRRRAMLEPVLLAHF